jgi:hypothetical protein
METSQLFLLVCTVLCFYCTGASWLLQIVCYPTYALVGEQEFVPFHVDFGKRLLVAAVVPMVMTAFLVFALVVVRPAATPQWATLVAAVCMAVVLGTTALFEVPRHLALDRDGKSLALINGLVRDNIPRVISWTLASLVLTYAVITTFTPAA